MGLLRLKSKSAWDYGTSYGKSGTFVFVTGTRGILELVDTAGKIERFSYFNVGGSSPTLGLNFTASIGGSQASYPSTGAIYTLGGLAGTELKRADFLGATLSIVIAAGIVNVFEVSATLFGIPPDRLQAEFIGLMEELAVAVALPGWAGDVFRQRCLNRIFNSHSKGVLLAASTSKGLVVGASAAGTFGLIY